MEQLPSTESYEERRKLFKDVWETSMNETEKSTNVLRKPKVIRTCRSREASEQPVSANKTRIRNLRTVCKKLLHCRERQAGNNLNHSHNRRRKYKIGNSKVIKLKKCKFSRTKRLMEKVRAPKTPPSLPEVINWNIEAAWCGIRFDIERDSSDINPQQSQNKIMNDKLQDNQSSNKKFCRSTEGKWLKPLVNVKKNLNNTHKELAKIHVINI